MPRTISGGSGSPTPTACERTGCAAARRASAGSMRTLARLAEAGGDARTTRLARATSRSTVARPRTMLARSSGSSGGGAPPRATRLEREQGGHGNRCYWTGSATHGTTAC